MHMQLPRSTRASSFVFAVARAVAASSGSFSPARFDPKTAIAFGRVSGSNGCDAESAIIPSLGSPGS
jgi:hypothetical protein